MMGKLTSKFKQKISPEITTWKTQAGNFTTSQKENVEFCLPEFSAAKILSWKCHVDSSTNSRYNMILGRDLLTDLGLGLKFSEKIIVGGDGPYKGCSAPMVDVSNCDFKLLTDKTVIPEESFINSYIDKCLESEIPIRSTHRIQITLDTKYKNSYLNKVMTKQCQHLSTKERERLLELLREFEDMFDGTLGTC